MPVLHVSSRVAACLCYMCVVSSSLSVLHVRNSRSINLKFASYNMYHIMYVIYLRGPDPDWNGFLFYSPPPPLCSGIAYPLAWAGPYGVCKLELSVRKGSCMSILHSYNLQHVHVT